MSDTSEPVAGESGESAASGGEPDNPAEPDRPPGASGVVAVVEVQSLASGVPTAWLQDRLGAAIALVSRPVARVTVRVTDDAGIAALHEQHLGIAGPTDVLTFPGSGNGAAVDADIAVNADEATRRAADLGHAPEREILLYALHGVLHCAGFDDHDPAGYAAMHAEEDRILHAIGVGPTFDPSDRPARSVPGDDQDPPEAAP